MDRAGIIITVLLFGGFTLFALAMLGVSLRLGPRRGTCNQPAAALARPGRGMFITLYAIAALHVLTGIAIAAAAPGGVGVLVVLVAMAVFYVLCAHSFALATSVAARRNPR